VFLIVVIFGITIIVRFCRISGLICIFSKVGGAAFTFHGRADGEAVGFYPLGAVVSPAWVEPFFRPTKSPGPGSHSPFPLRVPCGF